MIFSDKKIPLLELLKESDLKLVPVIAISVLSGASNAALLATINRATTNGDNRGDDLRLMFMSILCIAIFIITKKYVLKTGVFYVEELVRKVRIRIVNKIRHSELLMMEQMGTSDVYARISKDAVTVSQSAEIVSNGFQSLIMVVFSVIYVAFLSLPSFMIMILYFVLGIYAYMRISKAAQGLLQQATEKEQSFFETLDSILYGFKEIKVNKKKNDSVFSRFSRVTSQTKELYVTANYKFITSYIFAQSFFYILLMVIIFLMPMYSEMENDSIVKISSAILFIVGPMETFVSSIPFVMGANVAAGNIAALEEKLESNLKPEELEHLDDPDYDVEPMTFEKEVTLKDVAFQYPNEGFSVGPISLTIPKGEITFLSGGNGVGKSTFLKLIAGLYYPKSGSIAVDGTELKSDNYANHRELFSVIFTDFYLFERLYGLEDADQQKVNDLLKTMGIDEKTQVIDSEVTERNLSTGQKKRLALVISLLEDKSIYVLDEVAADQDPVFKKYFYKELLFEMKRQGKTVMVVTHDDFYFDVCDNHYKLENGELVTAK
ncbi:MAG: pyoverdine export ABC transporter PvdE [Roseivirga sp.]